MVSISTLGGKMNHLSGVRAIMNDIEQTLKSSKGSFVNLSPGNPLIIPKIKTLLQNQNKKLIDSLEYEEIMCKYGATSGYRPFITSFLNYFNNKYNLNFKEENVLVTPGSQLAYYYAINTFAGIFDNGIIKKVFLPQSPEYTGYSNMGIDHSLLKAIKPSIVFIGDHEFKYHINFDEFDLTDVGVIIFSRPCNPSGNILSDDETQKIIKLAKKRNIPVIIDSAYAPPIPNLCYSDMRMFFDSNVINIMSFSKAGLAGERIGVVIGQNEFIDPLKAFQANACIHAPKTGQVILIDAFKILENICLNDLKAFYVNKITMVNELFRKHLKKNVPYFLHTTEGTFFKWIWFKDLPINDWELYKKLKENRVIVVPGSTFFPGINDKWKHKEECIRISTTASNQDIRSGIKKISEVINTLY